MDTVKRIHDGCDEAFIDSAEESLDLLLYFSVVVFPRHLEDEQESQVYAYDPFYC